MRSVVVLAVLVSACVPNLITWKAGERLGVHNKRLMLMDVDTIDGWDVYTYCRREHRQDMATFLPVGGRSYDGACVTLVCPGGDDGHRCT
jgi:hypothetical protein